MTDLDIEVRPPFVDYEDELMRSPLAAQLRVVAYRMQVMMTEQGARCPHELVASSALPSGRSMLTSP